MDYNKLAKKKNSNKITGDIELEYNHPNNQAKIQQVYRQGTPSPTSSKAHWQE